MKKKLLPWDFRKIGERIANKNKDLRYVSFWIDEKNQCVEYYFSNGGESCRIYKSILSFKVLRDL